MCSGTRGHDDNLTIVTMYSHNTACNEIPLWMKAHENVCHTYYYYCYKDVVKKKKTKAVFYHAAVILL